MQQVDKNTANYFGFYDYQLKYVPENTVFLVDAQKKNSTYNRQFVVSDAETGSTSYFKLTFTENATENLSGGTVSLEDGTYDLFIYSSTTGNLLTSAADFLYSEMMIVNPIEQTYFTP